MPGTLGAGPSDTWTYPRILLVLIKVLQKLLLLQLVLILLLLLLYINAVVDSGCLRAGGENNEKAPSCNRWRTSTQKVLIFIMKS